MLKSALWICWTLSVSHWSFWQAFITFITVNPGTSPPHLTPKHPLYQNTKQAFSLCPHTHTHTCMHIPTHTHTHTTQQTHTHKEGGGEKERRKMGVGKVFFWRVTIASATKSACSGEECTDSIVCCFLLHVHFFCVYPQVFSQWHIIYLICAGPSDNCFLSRPGADTVSLILSSLWISKGR